MKLTHCAACLQPSHARANFGKPDILIILLEDYRAFAIIGSLGDILQIVTAPSNDRFQVSSKSSLLIGIPERLLSVPKLLFVPESCVVLAAKNDGNGEFISTSVQTKSQNNRATQSMCGLETKNKRVIVSLIGQLRRVASVNIVYKKNC